MGHKIHPEGFRVGYIHDWKSNWFNERDFADYLNEDLEIRSHIENKLSHAGLSKITIKKGSGEVEVDIFTARPGIVIGKSGSEVDALRRELHKLTGKPVLARIAIAGGGLERFGTEIRNLQRTEVREVEEPFGAGQKGSSAMPHKRNPILAERLCGLARVLRGYSQVGIENI